MSPTHSSLGDDAPWESPVASGKNAQQQMAATSAPGQKTHPDAGAEGDNQRGDFALSPVVSVDGLPSGEGGGVGGELKREQKRPSDLAALRLEGEKLQVRIVLRIGLIDT